MAAAKTDEELLEELEYDNGANPLAPTHSSYIMPPMPSVPKHSPYILPSVPTHMPVSSLEYIAIEQFNKIPSPTSKDIKLVVNKIIGWPNTQSIDSIKTYKIKVRELINKLTEGKSLHLKKIGNEVYLYFFNNVNKCSGCPAFNTMKGGYKKRIRQTNKSKKYHKSKKQSRHVKRRSTRRCSKISWSRR